MDCFRGDCEHRSLWNTHTHTRIHLFCPLCLQNGLTLNHTFHRLVRIFVMEDSVYMTLSVMLLFSLEKYDSFGYHANKNVSDKTWVWIRLAYEILHVKHNLWHEDLQKMGGGEFIQSSVLLHISLIFSWQVSTSLHPPHHTHTGFHTEHAHPSFWWKWGHPVPGPSKGKHHLQFMQALISGLQIKCFAWWVYSNCTTLCANINTATV